MRIVADLHLHSRFSRATSSRLNPAYLDRWARIKGIGLVGTGDCTHPRWLAELREQLDNREEGLYTLKKTVRRDFDAGPARTEGLPRVRGGDGTDAARFVLTGEISTIYKWGDKTRKIHHVIILPDFRAAAAFQTRLERVGNISSDGRPILGINSRDLLALLLDTDDRALLIPAHIWTPWFSALGAKSGFDSIAECYGDLAACIPAVETGLSSNPPMNWALSSLDQFSIISTSDAHSPDKLGREATVFDAELSYPSLRAALWRQGGGIIETIEFFPQEGKYHYDGHRKCGCWLEPEAALAARGLCPVCGKDLTRGVMGRVLELADRPVDETQAAPDDPGGGNRRPYRSLIPLREILGELLETGAASKKVDGLYGILVEKAGSELGILMDMPLTDIERLRPPGLSGELLADAMGRMRSGRVSISPGYDGEYGVIRAFAPGETPVIKFQTELFAAEGAGPRPGPPEKWAKDSRRIKPPADTGTAPADSAPGPGTARTESGPPPFALNAEQEQAVSHGGRQAIIIAGPGTGKTATLAARISRLIREGADPRSILALSFTAKAAAELGERIAAALGGKATSLSAGITAATFHSFCLSLLKEEAGQNGVPQNFRIPGEGERENILREICAAGRKAGTGNKRIGPEKLGEYIEGRKRFLLLPGETAPGFGGPGFETLVALAAELGIPEAEPDHERLYGLYRNRLRSLALIDFDDLVAGTVRLLCGNREQLARRRKRFRFIFVDEYQDVNFAQYALIRLLTSEGEDVFPPGENRAGDAPALWVIGDPNQAIYGFRGSDKRFIERFLEDYPRAGRFHLTRSFRCAAPIIKAAGTLMNTRLRGTEGEAALFRYEYPTEKAEAEGIARSIARLIGGASFFAIDSGTTDNGAGETDAADIAVLIRSAALAPPLVKALRDHGIPFEFTGEKPWWEEEPARAVLDVLREGRCPAGGAPVEAVERARELLQKNGTLPAGKKAAAPESLERLLNLASLYNDLSALLETLAIRAPGDLPELPREGVKLMTIHASKGLEFDQVFLAALEEGLLPFTLYDDYSTPEPGKVKTPLREQRIEEERRLLYVAMTRARRGLSLSWARRRNFHGRTLEGGPSPFFAELETLIPLGRDFPSRPRDPQMNLF
ncbi:MAG: UvrD-helicase domain-containing protein [Treponema sp.]|jgi:uncharacterized protein (TIGR00375 family)|nr:UvrD-helicase domain-containing protein [Treponema sp.]